MADPIHQFQIVNYFPLGKIGPVNLAFTNSALYMGIAVGIIAALMLGATAQRQLVPGRLQSVAELAYEFIADTIRNTVGEGGMQFFPLVFSLFMFILVSNMVGLIPYNFTVASHALMLGATARRQLVPGRLQSVAELAYEFIADTLRNTVGEGGMQFFPLVFSLFMFILVSNMVGLIPYNFTVASHLIVTVALALVVFFTVIIYGFWKNGLHFFKKFVPSGVPVYILPFVVMLEVFSFFVQPVSHSVRLFANMLAGHITLKVFAAFITMLGGLGVAGWVGATLPLALTVALTALELLVAFLQAYVFTILTCIYLNDAVHPGGH